MKEPKPDKIDNLDRNILNIIMGNARTPSKEVAEMCGVSRAAVHQRVQKLMDLDIITGSGYSVNPHKLGFDTCTFIGVKLERGSLYREVARELENIPEVVECNFTTGPYSMLIKVYARDNRDLMNLLNNRIQHIHGVTETETMIVLEQTMDRHIMIPLDFSRRNAQNLKKNSR
ncbi:MAG: AsnC family transcriptional regulator [Bacteroides sp.]|nr:AsnC family transcriptional regulator [Bacteroides sp.]MDE6231055.1 Lrp/AsnC ligand binding domain-containing protein [Muribaculaceae bacterium]